MPDTKYEKITLADSGFPIIFHDEKSLRGISVGMQLHWHEHLELLLFIEGEGIVFLNDNPYNVCAGDLVVINSNTLHSMPKKPVNCTYHCFIVDRQFCEANRVSIELVQFKECIKDSGLQELYLKMVSEMQRKEVMYKTMVQGYMAEFLAGLVRHYSAPRVKAEEGSRNTRLEIVKEIVNYINRHFSEELDIEKIALQSGYTKFYVCHAFKEVTGQTIMQHLTLFRCNQARQLLSTGKYTVSECANACGYRNMSYFSKQYKKYIGELPSVELNRI